MLNITFFVTPRVQITPDAQGRWPITPEMLNDMARPIVTGYIDEHSFIPYPVFSIGDESSNTITVGVQFMLSTGTYTGRIRVRAWITEDSSTCAVSSEPITSVPEMHANQFDLVTSPTGQFNVQLSYSGDKTFYLCLEFNGKVWVSDAITFVGV